MLDQAIVAGKGLGLLAVVLNDYKLKIIVGGMLQERRNAFLKHIRMIARGDHDTHQRMRLRELVANAIHERLACILNGSCNASLHKVPL